MKIKEYVEILEASTHESDRKEFLRKTIKKLSLWNNQTVKKMSRSYDDKLLHWSEFCEESNYINKYKKEYYPYATLWEKIKLYFI